MLADTNSSIGSRVACPGSLTINHDAQAAQCPATPSPPHANRPSALRNSPLSLPRLRLLQHQRHLRQLPQLELHRHPHSMGQPAPHLRPCTGRRHPRTCTGSGINSLVPRQAPRAHRSRDNRPAASAPRLPLPRGPPSGHSGGHNTLPRHNIRPGSPCYDAVSRCGPAAGGRRLHHLLPNGWRPRPGRPRPHRSGAACRSHAALQRCPR